MRKLIISVLMIITVLSGCAESKEIVYSDSEKVEIVDDVISEILASEEYNSDNTEKAREFVNDKLRELQGDGYIRNLKYYGDSRLFSFKYSDGTLGGVQLQQEDLGLEMN